MLLKETYFKYKETDKLDMLKEKDHELGGLIKVDFMITRKDYKKERNFTIIKG